jgi:DNA replication protein DnaC
MKRLLELSNIPSQKQLIKLIPTEEDKEIHDKLSQYSKQIKLFIEQGNNLYLCSKYCGNGKSSWAIRLMMSYFDKIWSNSYDVTRGVYVHVPTFLLDLKRFDNQPEYINRILDADVVIWDDIAFSNKLTEYEHEQLIHFIDYRMSKKKSNFYTSNIVNETDLSSIIGQRLSSRIFNESIVLEFKSKDFRDIVKEHRRRNNKRNNSEE